MPSSAHQSLLLWITRKMVADGFVLSGCDGTMDQGGFWNKICAPPQVRGIRPDACAIAPDSGEVAFGEAKTYNDVDTPHTRRQLRILGYLKHRSGRARCRLYFAVPRSAAPLLDRVLRDVGLLGARHIVRLHIPDCFVESHDHAA
jgi:hypothetical protein